MSPAPDRQTMPPWLDVESQQLRAFHDRKLEAELDPSLHSCSRPFTLKLLLARLTRIALHTALLASALALITAGLGLFTYLWPPSTEILPTPITSSASVDGATHSNPTNEKIFIAGTIEDAASIHGTWGQSVLELVHILGPPNVFLSIASADASYESQAALRWFADQVSCNKSITTNAALDPLRLAAMTPPDGRLDDDELARAAELRNRALEPLRAPPNAPSARAPYDKVLFLDDVVFQAQDAAKLLFDTHYSPERRASTYELACAVDLAPGIPPHVPVDPARRTALPVRACWAGLVAANAKYFQPQPDAAALRFRPPPRGASETCLLNADIVQRYHAAFPRAVEFGIYVNSQVRVRREAKGARRAGPALLQGAWGKMVGAWPGVGRKAGREGAGGKQVWTYDEGETDGGRGDEFCGLR